MRPSPTNGLLQQPGGRARKLRQCTWFGRDESDGRSDPLAQVLLIEQLSHSVNRSAESGPLVQPRLQPAKPRRNLMLAGHEDILHRKCFEEPDLFS